MPERCEFFFAINVAPFLETANQHMTPAKLSSQARHDIETAIFSGPWTFIRLETKTKADASKGTTALTTFFYGLRRGRGFVGVVLRGGEEDHLIVPVEWLRRVIAIGFADATATRDWYVAMSQRLATAGKASGIAVLATGDAMGIEVDLNYRGGGEELVARVKLLRAGEYNADDWGPRIDGAVTVSIGTMNGHDGITMQDLLGEQLKSQKPKSIPTPKTTSAMAH